MYRYKVICKATGYVYCETMARDIAENAAEYIKESLGIAVEIETI